MTQLFIFTIFRGELKHFNTCKIEKPLAGVQDNSVPHGVGERGINFFNRGVRLN